MRKFYSFSLLMLLSMTLCGIMAVAQTVTVDNIVYELLNNGTARLQNGKSATGNVVIPAEVEYEGKKYPVVLIYQASFRWNTAITSVELPVSVKNIEQGAFHFCKGLVSVTGGCGNVGLFGVLCFRRYPLVCKPPCGGWGEILERLDT